MYNKFIILDIDRDLKVMFVEQITILTHIFLLLIMKHVHFILLIWE